MLTEHDEEKLELKVLRMFDSSLIKCDKNNCNFYGHRPVCYMPTSFEECGDYGEGEKE